MLSFLIQKIKEIDLEFFHFIHETIKNPFLDKWMPIVTDTDNWIWPLALGWLALFIFGGRKGRLTCILLVVVVLFCDNLVSYILKPFFGRVRPNVELGLASSPSPSFPSNHATNAFAIAFVLSWYYRRLIPIWFLWAVTVGFSRIYVGVHYPFDIIGGLIVGIACAPTVIWIGNYVVRLRRKYVRDRYA